MQANLFPDEDDVENWLFGESTVSAVLTYQVRKAVFLLSHGWYPYGSFTFDSIFKLYYQQLFDSSPCILWKCKSCISPKEAFECQRQSPHQMAFRIVLFQDVRSNFIVLFVLSFEHRVEAYLTFTSRRLCWIGQKRCRETEMLWNGMSSMKGHLAISHWGFWMQIAVLATTISVVSMAASCAYLLRGCCSWKTAMTTHGEFFSFTGFQWASRNRSCGWRNLGEATWLWL